MFESIRKRHPSGSVAKAMVYTICAAIARSCFRVFFRVRVHHSDRVPAHGALMIAANHQSYLDPPLVGAFITQRPCAFIARAGLFKFKPFGWFISAINAMPIKEEKGDMGAIRTALDVLSQGHAILIFPEGSRSHDGAMHEFKRGVSLLVKRADCPIVPVAVEGCFDAWPIKNRLPSVWSCPVEIMYGTPISRDELMRDGADKGLERLASIIESMRRELRASIRERTGGRHPATGPGDANPSKEQIAPAKD